MYPRPDPAVLTEELEDSLARLIRSECGLTPRKDVLVLGSTDGFLGPRLVEQAPAWTVHTLDPVPEQAPEALRPVEAQLPELPFRNGQLGMITGAFLDEPWEHWSRGLAEEARRSLGPRGPVHVLLRGPSPEATRIQRTLEVGAEKHLQAVGFEEVETSRAARLPDGSWVLQLHGRAPG